MSQFDHALRSPEQFQMLARRREIHATRIIWISTSGTDKGIRGKKPVPIPISLGFDNCVGRCLLSATPRFERRPKPTVHIRVCGPGCRV